MGMVGVERRRCGVHCAEGLQELQLWWGGRLLYRVNRPGGVQVVWLEWGSRRCFGVNRSVEVEVLS